MVLRWSDVRQHVPVEIAERARTGRARRSGRRARLRRRRIHGRTRQGGRADHRAADPRRAHDVRRLGGDQRVGADRGRGKTTGVDDRVLPTSIVYDADLTLTLPVDLSVASGLNALAHCVDSLWAPRADPINQALALEGARALADGLPVVVGHPRDTAGRDQALYGAYLAAVAFASAGSGLHHKICHVLGGAFNLPHAADPRRRAAARAGPQRPGGARAGSDGSRTRSGRARFGRGCAGAPADQAARAPRAARLRHARGAHPRGGRRIREAVPVQPGHPHRRGPHLLLRAAWSGEPPRSTP